MTKYLYAGDDGYGYGGDEEMAGECTDCGEYQPDLTVSYQGLGYCEECLDGKYEEVDEQQAERQQMGITTG